MIDVFTVLAERPPTIVGSQSVYASLDPVPELSRVSNECDFLMLGLTAAAREKIQADYGITSEFQVETGTHIDLVGLATVVLPEGWQNRLVPLKRPSGETIAYCLDIYDLFVSKFFAGREKDLLFMTGLFAADRLEIDRVAERLSSMATSPQANALPERLDRLINSLSKSNIDRTIIDRFRELKRSLGQL
ncbi:MAG: DUF6036 family nucleotidyltransferase [Pyrinomonadaceae bacterium]